MTSGWIFGTRPSHSMAKGTVASLNARKRCLPASPNPAQSGLETIREPDVLDRYWAV